MSVNLRLRSRYSIDLLQNSNKIKSGSYSQVWGYRPFFRQNYETSQYLFFLDLFNRIYTTKKRQQSADCGLKFYVWVKVMSVIPGRILIGEVGLNFPW